MFNLIIISAVKDDPQAVLVPRFDATRDANRPFVNIQAAPDCGMRALFLSASEMILLASNAFQGSGARSDPLNATLDGIAFLAGAIQRYQETHDYDELPMSFARLKLAANHCACLKSDHKAFIQDGYSHCFNSVDKAQLWTGYVEILYMMIGELLRNYEDA